MEKVKKQLEEKGYVVIKDVLQPSQIQKAKQYFETWRKNNPQVDKLHDKISPHSIYKHFGVGHTKMAWFIRTLPNVQKYFKQIWNCDDLAVSFDGSCYMSKEKQYKDKNVWTHTDQAPKTKGLQCYQGFVSLTDNKIRTLVLYEGSHLLHEQYMGDRNITHSKNWEKIDPLYLESKEIQLKKKVLEVPAGSLVLWDSRTFHQNQYGYGSESESEERLVQYVCFLPKNSTKYKESQKKKRMKYLEEKRTTSHYPFPVKVNGLQPRTYGNNDLLVDYSIIKHDDLTELNEKILKLI